MRRKPLTKDEALLKMAALCARSEQCTFDISSKLRAAGLAQPDIDSVLGELVERRFLDESRYAAAYARDKVRFSAWGPLKVRAGLAAKRITGRAAAVALEAVDPQDYADALARSARAKAAYVDLSTKEGRVKLFRHLLSRGFRSEESMAVVRKIMSEA